MAIADEFIDKPLAVAAAGVNVDVVVAVVVVALRGATTGMITGVRVVCEKDVTEMSISEIQLMLAFT